MKQCSKCKKWKLRNKFYKDKTRKDGLEYWCKICNAKDERIRYRRKNPIVKHLSHAEKYKVVRGITKKFCGCCSTWKSLSMFSKNKRNKDGLNCYCKTCKAEYGKKNYQTIEGYLRRIFYTMNCRCTNSKAKDYKRYGAKGIQVKFKSFDGFFHHVTTNLGYDTYEKIKGLQVHRTKKHYEIGGIEFLTPAEHRAKHKAMRTEHRKLTG